jgi:hypothetical protein
MAILHNAEGRRKRASAWSLQLGCLALLVGCGGDDGKPTTTIGQAIITPSVQSVVLLNPGGGFTPAPPAGSTCLVGARSFTLALESGQLQWTKCLGDGVMPYRSESGMRTLAATELKDLTAQLGKLTVVKAENGCITDVPMLSVTVKTALAEQKYVDDGFNCQVKDGPFLSRTVVTDTMNKFETYAK